MGWRTVVVNKNCKLSYKNDYLVIRSETLQMIHLSEINLIIVENGMVSITSYLINELINNKIKLIFCDEKHNPAGEVMPYYGSFNTSKKILNSYSKFTSVLDEFIQTNIPSSTIKVYVREQIDTMPSWTVISRAVDSSGSALVETYSMPGMNLYVAFPDENSVRTASTIINGMLENKKYDTINK